MHQTRWAGWSFLSLPLLSFAAGVTLALGLGHTDPDSARALLLFSITASVFALPVYAAFRYFAAVCAITVYRDFYTFVRSKQVFAGSGRT